MKIGQNCFWLMTQMAFQDLKDLAFNALKASIEQRSEQSESLNGGLEPNELTIRDGLAVIQLRGPMLRGIGRAASYYGLADTDRVRRAVEYAAKSEDVESILMIIDSPGGSVSGLPELGDAVFNARKKKQVVAQVECMAASAALYVASQASEVYAGRMDLIGSIGTTIQLFDLSEMFKNEGIRSVVIDTGEHKSTGAPGEPITENQEAEIQRIVNGFFKDFKKAVVRGRESMTAKDVSSIADGRIFFASEAKEFGLIDGIQTTDKTMSKVGKTKTRVKTRQHAAAELDVVEQEMKGC